MVCLFVCLFSCVGCSFVEDIIGEDDDDGNKYVWEMGLIYDYQAESISGCTFEQIKSIRNRLKTKSCDYEPAITVNETEIRDFLQGMFTPTEIETHISFLNKNGNIILYFYYKYDSSKFVWCYFEKL